MRVNHHSEIKQAFLDWLLKGNYINYSPYGIVYCIDKISGYALRSNYSHTDFWHISKPDEFEEIYTKIISEASEGILNRSTFRGFVQVGPLYIKFLKEKNQPEDKNDSSSEQITISTLPSRNLDEKKGGLQTEKQLGKQELRDIDPENLILWLITQTNANGTLYLERVVRQYIWALRIAPAILVLDNIDNRNVFSCQTVDELNFLWDIFKSAPNYKDVNQRVSGQFSAGLSCLSRYLKYLSEYPEYTPISVKTAKQLQNTIQPIRAIPPIDSPILVDFDKPGLCARTEPVLCIINGQAVTPKKMNWSQLLIAIIERFLAERNPQLAELDKRPMYGSKAFFLSYKPNIGTSALLSNGKWISTNYPPQIIVVIIRNLCRHCGVELEDVSISYLPKSTPTEWSAKQSIHGKASIPDLFSVNKAFNLEVVKAVSDILTAHFPNGFRVNSPIELMRFRSYSDDASVDGLPAKEEELIRVISSCGTLFEGKVYIVSNETKCRLKEEINTQVDSGLEILYYSKFFDQHESWLFAGKIISEAMLKQILKTLFPEFTYKAGYFSTNKDNGTELSTIEKEILRVWNGDVLLNYEQIASRLPYIPLDKIKYVLTINSIFIWNSTEVYTHIGMVDISDEERANIQDYVDSACRTTGYASMSDIPLSAIEDHNNELSLTAIQNAVFTIVLSGNYEKHGKIVTRKGDTLDALYLMKEWCYSLDKCTLNELIQYEQDLTGDEYPWVALEAGYTIMVRTSEDTFVAEKYVHFDEEKIDTALDLFMTGQYLPLKSVTTFATFPHCGQSWNLFLLESYCRRFSRRYRFESLSMNSRNVGTIVRKNCDLSYSEILTDAVAASNVELKKTTVIEFLYTHGYIGRRHYGKTDELVEQAKILRERRN
jgi:hypothetical protein